MARPAGSWMFAQMFGTGDGKEWSTDYWYKTTATAPPSSFDPVTLALAVWTNFSGAIAGVMNQFWYLQGCAIEVNFGSGTFGAKYYSTLAGTGMGGAMPEDVAAVVRKNTASGGRSYTGVNRYGMLDNLLCTGSYLNASGVIAFAAVKTATIANIASQSVTYTAQVYSRKLNVLNSIVGLEILGLLGTTRRRRPRF